MGFKDIFIFKEEHEHKASKIMDLFLEDNIRNSYEGIISVCGISGCGKSEIAWWVARKLYKFGISSYVINLDRFYKVPVEGREEHRKDTGIIGHQEMDWDRINAEVKHYNNHDIKVLIFEGLYAGYIGGTQSYYIESSLEDAEYFRKLRGKEDEYSEWRAYVVGEEMSDIQKAMHKYNHKIC